MRVGGLRSAIVNLWVVVRRLGGRRADLGAQETGDKMVGKFVC